MSEDKTNYLLSRAMKTREVVSIPVSLSKSIEGKYFVGQTEPLHVCKGSDAWAGLVNPRNSNVILFVNVFTISNFSDEHLTAEIWLNASLPENLDKSYNVSPTNTAIKPLPKNRINILSSDSDIVTPKKGINVYKRIVQPNETLVAEEDGKFIIAPGGNYSLIIKSTNLNHSKVVVAFGWWEEEIC